MKLLNREQWLDRATKELRRQVFKPLGYDVPDVRVSVGFPGGRGPKTAVIGQCWEAKASGDKVPQMFVSPVIDNPTRVLDILAHEMIHAFTHSQGQSGHRGLFRKVALSIGLTGKMTATVAGPELQEILEGIVERIGEYPHSALNPGLSGIKKQTTRMIKVVCPSTEYTARTTRKWLDSYGAPLCPCCELRMEIE